MKKQKRFVLILDKLEDKNIVFKNFENTEIIDNNILLPENVSFLNNVAKK